MTLYDRGGGGLKNPDFGKKFYDVIKKWNLRKTLTKNFRPESNPPSEGSPKKSASGGGVSTVKPPDVLVLEHFVMPSLVSIVWGEFAK